MTAFGNIKDNKHNFSSALVWSLNVDTLKSNRERVRKDSIRVEEKRKHLGESERRFISEREKEHLVRRYPGNARSSF
jgi:hypothetical protein